MELEKTQKQKEEEAKIETQRGTTNHVLHVVYGSDHPEPHQPKVHEHEEEDKVEIDERWLMTYADKMTLLCGFFIMLYAMSTMNPKSQQEIIDSTRKKFGQPQGEQEIEKKEREAQQEIQKIKREKIELETKVQFLETKVTELTPKPPPVDQVKQLQEEKQKLEQELNVIPDLRLQIMKIEQENKELKEKIQVKKVEPPPKTIVKVIKSPLQPRIDPKELLKPVQERLEITENRLAETRRELTTVQQKLESSETTVAQLQREITKAQTAAASSMFLAFMIKWPTNDHDVDLTVEDPSGKRFDFKNRKISGHPGMFVLDTRRGPGIEVWQADKIIPGTYKFTYTLYNAYGNRAPCPITATLFSAKGSLEIPVTTLDISARRSASIKVQVGDDGKAQIR